MRTGNFSTRQAAADYLTERTGRRVTRTMLAQYAVKGTGPKFHIVLGRASYLVEDLEIWLEQVAISPETRLARRARAIERNRERQQTAPVAG